MRSRRDHQPEGSDADTPSRPTQAELDAMFDADDADVEAGRTVPAAPVLAEMRATVARIRAERAARGTRVPRPA